MVKPWRCQAQGTIEQELARRGPKQIFTTNNLGDLHRRIIHHHGKLISRRIVMPPNDEIAKILSGDKLLLTATAIGKRNHLAMRNAKTPVDPGCGLQVASCRLACARD